MKKQAILAIPSILAILSCAGAAIAQPATLNALNGLGGMVSGISADGTVAVGVFSNQAVRWVGGVRQNLGFLGGGDSSNAQACSANGSVVVGFSDDATDWTKPFRWTQAGGMTAYPLLPQANTGEAFAVTADGTTAAGFCAGISVSGFWILATRFTTSSATSLGTIAGYSDPIAWGTSGDATVIVGIAMNNATEMGRAFWWTAGGGMQALPEAAPTGSVAKGISSDGRVAVGMSFAGPNSGLPVRWRSCGGGALPAAAEVLGALPGHLEGLAHHASANGAVIVGHSGVEETKRAIIWTETTGVRDLKAVLAAAGANVNGWTLREATGVSGNGRTIVGNGTNPQGLSGPWIATLPASCGGNCDGSTVAPMLNANDFACFLAVYASAHSGPACHQRFSYANCDGSTTAPVLNANDFQCYLNAFVAGCQ